MPEPVDSLILDLLEFVGSKPRPYAEVLDEWRTSCPRLPVWEDALDLGFVERRSVPGQAPVVAVTTTGAAHLCSHRHAIDT